MNVNKIMSSDVIQITPDTTVSQAAEAMRTHDVGILPVCDENNQMMGIVTDRDIVVRLMNKSGDWSQTTIRGAITPEVVCVSPDTDCEIAADIMAEEKIRRLPVVNDDGRLVGMLSLGDLASVKSMDAVCGDAMHDICSCKHRR